MEQDFKKTTATAGDNWLVFLFIQLKMIKWHSGKSCIDLHA